MLEYLSGFDAQWKILNLFNYITVRTGGAILTALCIAFAIGAPAIDWLRRAQGKGQPIREDGPATHLLTKRGTPTMGGLIILISLCGAAILCANLRNPIVWATMAVTLGFGLVGFIDDLAKVTKQSHRGLSGWIRLSLEFSIALAAVIFLLHAEWVASVPNTPPSLQEFVRALVDGGTLTQLALPFVNDWGIQLYAAYPIFAAVIVVGFGNAVNFTDGLDGLAIVPVMIAAATFSLIAYLVGRADYSAYLGVPFVTGAGELAPILGALVGASLGFLWYNAPPARIFMGDTGSLALGGLLGIAAVATKHEIVLLVVGGLFVIETLSVIVQVIVFKLTGTRVFLMAPIHHHFEKLGWSESTIVVRFWIVAAVLAMVGLATLKLR